jgi:hypothetical protein
LGLLLGPMAGITLSHAASPQSPPEPPQPNSSINPSMPGAQTGRLMLVNHNSVQIDNATYTVTPDMVLEDAAGDRLHMGTLKKIPPPIPVKFWVGKRGNITHMILLQIKERPKVR